jgi:hypothetical protein
MKPELQATLIKRFPMLYRGYYKSMRETCMCWGFDVGDGWYPIIYSLSLAIEDELKRVHPWYVRRYWRQLEWLSERWNEALWFVLRRVKSDLFEGKPVPYTKIIERDTLRGKIYCFLLGLLRHPRYFSVTQVKEKFGSLRYYTGWETEAMSKYISVACHASANTCEVCGSWGKRNSMGWISCLCDKCRKEYNEERGIVADENDGDDEDEG